MELRAEKLGGNWEGQRGRWAEVTGRRKRRALKGPP